MTWPLVFHCTAVASETTCVRERNEGEASDGVRVKGRVVTWKDELSRAFVMVGSGDG